MNLLKLADALSKSRNVTLVVGAGISSEMKIPLGYKIPLVYGENHPNLLKKYGLTSSWKQAKEAAEGKKWEHEHQFVQDLVSQFMQSIELQRSFVDWLAESKDEGIRAMSGAPSDIHAAFVIAWLNRVFSHLVTTNWDFLLEYHVDAIYHPEEISDGVYPSPFDPVKFKFVNGQSVTIEADRLHILDPVNEEEYFWEARWDIMASRSDLVNLHKWTRPIWKIHGSPFFLACPQCGGFSRWKRVEKLTVGDPCPNHSEETLKPEIIFWGQRIDSAVVPVWKRLKGRLQRSDMIIACGFSGSGSDLYIRRVIETHPNAWVVDPKSGEWDTLTVNHVAASASDFAKILIERFLT